MIKIISGLICLAGAMAMLWVLKVKFQEKSFSLKMFQIGYCAALLIFAVLQLSSALVTSYRLPTFFINLYTLADMLISAAVIPYILYHKQKKQR